MPLYDYCCDECGTTFEVRATIKQKQDGLEPECPKCHSHAARQVITAGLVLHGNGGAAGNSGCNCGPSGCCS